MTPESAPEATTSSAFHLGAAASPHSHAEDARQLCETCGVAAQANVRRFMIRIADGASIGSRFRIDRILRAPAHF